MGSGATTTRWRSEPIEQFNRRDVATRFSSGEWISFSEAYGDHGFTLVLEPLRTYIATHHHFESVEAAIERGDDIVPTRTVVREWEEPRRVADSQRGRVLGFAMERLERLIEAYWWPTIVFTIGITGLALPPLTGIDAPLRNEALSEATNRIASAISSGRPRRLSGAPEPWRPLVAPNRRTDAAFQFRSGLERRHSPERRTARPLGPLFPKRNELGPAA